MRPSLSLLPLAVLLAQGIHAQAKDIDVCTQVTRQYITNGDFATDSGWTASDDYTIVTKSGSDSGYMLVEQTSHLSYDSLTEGKQRNSVCSRFLCLKHRLVPARRVQHQHWALLPDGLLLGCDRSR